MGPLRLNQESLFPFVLQCSKLESIINDESWSIFFFFFSLKEYIFRVRKKKKKVFSCHCAKFDFWKNTHRTCHRDWMSALISYKMDGVMFLFTYLGCPSGNIKTDERISIKVMQKLRLYELYLPMDLNSLRGFYFQ